MNRVFAFLTALLLATPLYAQQVSESPFGVVCPWGGLKEMGIKWVRSGAGATSFDWRNHEKERGIYDFSSSDNEINGVGRQEDLSYVVLLGYTPEWASCGPKGECSYPPGDLQDWHNYVYQIVSHFKGRVKYWEVWNEQDIGFFQGTIDDYVAMLRSACTAAKKADPECKIVFGGLAGINLPFIERAYQLGAGPYFDVMAVHPYQWGVEFNDNWFVDQHVSLRELMNKYGDSGKEIWLTEFGWSTGDAGITQEVQARLLVQSMVTCLSMERLGVSRFFWFVIKDWGGPGHGLLDTDGKRKMSGEACAALTSRLTGSKYLGAVSLGEKVRCHVFKPKEATNKLLAVLWSSNKENQPVKLDFGYLAQVSDMLGKPVSVTTSIVQATPNPIYILVDENALKGRIKAPKAVKSTKPGTWLQRKDVWVNLLPPAGTSRAWFAEGIQEKASLVVHNDSGSVSIGRLELKIKDAPGDRVRVPFRILPGKNERIDVCLPIPEKTGVTTLEVSGRADGKEMIPLSVPVRVSRGPVIEFLANSTVERAYFHGPEPGGAPSIRFGGPWVYCFDLTGAKSAEVSCLAGAHMAQPWQILASTDGEIYEILLSGESNRAWHSINLDRFAGRKVYIKFDKPDIQLAELVLSTVLK